MTAEEVKKVLAVLRYHNHCKVKNDPDYLDSSLEEDTLQAMHHSNRFIGDAQDNMKVCRHKVNEVLKEYGYKDLMIKREEKFRYRNDLANRIFEIYESL